MRALHSHRTAMAGLFGVKVHWDQMVQVRAEGPVGSPIASSPETPATLFARMFPTSRFVRILRLDLDRQAVSY